MIYDAARGLWTLDPTGKVLNLATDVAAHYLADARGSKDLPRQRGLQDQAKTLMRPMALREMLEFAAIDPALAITSDRLDPDPYLLKVSNGVLDLRTGQFREARPEDLLTMESPVAYDPAAKCPRFLRFLEEVTGGDMALERYMMKLAGHALTGDATEEIVTILFGSGGNGKSKYLDVLRSLLGTYAAHSRYTTFSARSQDTGHREDLVRLARKRLVTVSEMEAKFDEALLKEISGGDPMTVRDMWARSTEFRPQLKLLFMTNKLPQIPSQRAALWRRLKVVPFLQKFEGAKRDKKLLPKLLAELPGILNLALRGCLAWQKEGLEDPPAVLAATSRYREESDSVAPFIEQCCESGKGLECPRGALYDAYREWCARSGERPLSKSDFKKDLEGRDFKGEDRNQGRYWLDLRLLPPKEPTLDITGDGGK